MTACCLTIIYGLLQLLSASPDYFMLGMLLVISWAVLETARYIAGQPEAETGEAGGAVAPGIKQTEINRTAQALDDAQRIAQIGSWRWDVVNDRLISCSQEFARIYGVSMDEITEWLEHQKDRVIYEEDRDYVQQQTRLFDERNASYEIEYRIVRADGEIRHVIERGEPVMKISHKVIEQFGTMQDITDYRAALEGIKDQRVHYQLMLDELDIGVQEEDYSSVKRRLDALKSDGVDDLKQYFIDHPQEVRQLAGEIVDVSSNQGLHKLYGATNLEEFVEDNSCIDEWWSPAWESYFIREFDSLVRGGVFLSETEDTRIDGSTFYMRSRTKVLRGFEKNWEKVFTIHEDVTEQKKIEADMLEAMDSAKRANQAKSQFLANMSHEIRTPMNAILGMTHLALKTDLDRNQLNYVRKAHDAAENLLVVINDILDISKIEAGKLELEHVQFDLRDVINDLNNLISVKADENAVRFESNLSAEVPTGLFGDPLRLGQILINLVNNAVKFSHSGGTIKLNIELERETEKSAVLLFSVIDEGIGIARPQIEHLFTPFHQVDASTTRQFGGTGLGLAISSYLVGLMQGEIWVDSEEGRGSTFYFTAQLDVCSKAVDRYDLKSDQGEVDAAINSLRGARILLVEDNQINQELAYDLLAGVGMVVDTAENGKAALDKIESAAFDGVLMDCQMPVMDGYEATRRIREIERFSALPVIALTANAMLGDVDKVLEAGMFDHIAKPIDPDIMYLTMAKWINPADSAKARKIHLQGIDAPVCKS